MRQLPKQDKMIHHPHDKLFAKMLSDISIAISFLSKHLPQVWLKILDLSTLQLFSETTVNAEWKKSYSDIVFCCQKKGKPDELVYIFLEHLSNPKRLTPMRTLIYKLDGLGKLPDKRNPSRKLPNCISIVLYHGDRSYPYEKDIFSCFEDEELARQTFTNPIFVDLAETTEEEIVAEKGKDTALKLLLKYSRSKDFVQKLVELMDNFPEIFIPLSCEQAQLIYEYSACFTKGNPKNIKMMQTAFNKTYGKEKNTQFFSMLDYYLEEGREQGRKEGKEATLAFLKNLGVSQEILAQAEEKL